MNDISPPLKSRESLPLKRFFHRFVGIFIEPGETFEDLARKPDFIGPLTLLILVSVAVTETMLARIGAVRIVRTAIEQSGQGSAMSPEQIDAAVERGAAFAGLLAHIVSIMGVPVFLAAVAGFGLLVLNGFFGARVGFKAAFSVACYANLPSVLGGMMAVAVMLFGDPEHFNPQSPAPSDLGFFLDSQHTSRAVYRLASSLDIFVIWFLILLAIGLSRVSGGRAKARSIFVVYLCAWLVLIMVKVGIALVS
jgi:Yip1 domain